MMIGPEPMINTRWMSLRRGITNRPRSSAPGVLDKLHEIVEQVMRVVRAGRCFRMILNAEDRFAAVAETFQRLVIQVDVREFHFVLVERIGVHREADRKSV